MLLPRNLKSQLGLPEYMEPRGKTGNKRGAMTEVLLQAEVILRWVRRLSSASSSLKLHVSSLGRTVTDLCTVVLLSCSLLAFQ